MTTISTPLQAAMGGVGGGVEGGVGEGAQPAARGGDAFIPPHPSVLFPPTASRCPLGVSHLTTAMTTVVLVSSPACNERRGEG